MADSYNPRSRGSYSSSQYLPAQSSHNYTYPSTTQYTFHHPGTPSSQSSYTTDSPSPYSHHRSSSESVSPYPTYPTTASERAPKRHRTSSMTPNQGAHMQAQWADAPAPVHSDLHRAHGARHVHNSSGYDASGYSHSHSRRDPYYGQQHSHLPSGAHSSSAMSAARDSHPSSSEYEEDEEERVDHGPTELPPRTYTGKSKYDPPRKPGKIPGSAMDYLPILEARFDRLETAIDRYVDYRGQRALSNSILPGMGASDGSLSREGHSSSRHSYSTSRR